LATYYKKLGCCKYAYHNVLAQLRKLSTGTDVMSEVFFLLYGATYKIMINSLKKKL